MCKICVECMTTTTMTTTTTTTTRPPFPDCSVSLGGQVSAAALQLASGEAFEARLEAPGGRFELEVAPVGLSVDMRTGALRWQPDLSQAGLHWAVARTGSAGSAGSERCTLALEVAAVGALPAGVYVAPGGSDGDGSAAAPFGSVEAAVAVAAPGAVVYVRGGKHLLSFEELVVDLPPDQPVTITRLPGERVCFQVETNKIGFRVPQGSSGVTFRGLEMYGASELDDHWEILKTSWWGVQDVRLGGKTAFDVDGQHVIIEDCVIHDMAQKAVNIYKGRYVTVRHNVIYNIGHTSLSGGHGIMRKWERSFGDPDDPQYFRWDFYGNFIFNVEQRIYSFIPSKGYSNMVIDEGKSILTDITKDTKMTARISQNLMLFGGVDHLRLKENPNMLVQNNAIMAEEGRDHPVPDGITCKNNKLIPNLTLTENLVQTFAGSNAFDVARHFEQGGLAEGNYFAGGGVNVGQASGITDLGANASVFRDPSALDFRRSSAAGNSGVDDAVLARMFALAAEYAVQVAPSGWRHNHVRNADVIVTHAPSEHVTLTGHGDPSLAHGAGRVALFYSVTSRWYRDKCNCRKLEVILPEGYDLAKLPVSVPA
ncbi:unnamed protein product [Effrenium voratum]|nr:unnamed protein product [Effrenium voratum]